MYSISVPYQRSVLTSFLLQQGGMYMRSLMPCYVCRTRVPTRSATCSHCGALLLLETRYRLIQPIGNGGFGTVFEGVDQRLQRRCAVKAITALSDRHGTLIESEWQILRDYAHRFPFIPDIYDVITHIRTTYLVMEYVPGTTLNEMLDRPWAADEVQHFLRTLLGYLARLHATNLIHRDIKPKNIKQTPPPDQRYVLLDFGIANRDTSETHPLSKAATPPYSPLEQTEGRPTDERSDLFSLAATAYQLLLGITSDVLSRHLQHHEKLRQQMLKHGASTALAYALTRMLHSDAERRPSDAQTVLDWLADNYEGDIPSECELQQTTYAELAETAPVLAQDALAAEPFARLGRGRIIAMAGVGEGDLLAVATPSGVLLYHAQTLDVLSTLAPNRGVRAISFVEQGQTLAIVTATDLQLWRVPKTTLLYTCTEAIAVAQTVVVAPDGQHVATIDRDYVRMWRILDGLLMATLAEHSDGPAQDLAFAPDGQTLATVSRGELRLWQTRDGSLLSQHTLPVTNPIAVALPDTQTVVVITATHCLITSLNTSGSLVWSKHELVQGARRVLVAESGQMLVVLTDTAVHVLRQRGGNLRQGISVQTLYPGSAALVNNERLLGIALDQGLQLYHTQTGALISQILEHSGRINSIVFAPDGQMLLTAGAAVFVWRLADSALAHTSIPDADHAAARGIAVSPDGHLLAVALLDGVELRQSADWERVGIINVRCIQNSGIAFTADGLRLLITTSDGIELWDVASTTLLSRLPYASDEILGIALAPDGSRVAMIGDQAVDVYHAQETALVHRATLQLDDPVLAVAFAPHGPLLALATSPTVELWRSEDDAAPGVLDTGAQRMVFAPDGASLVTVWDDVAELWSVTDMMCIATFAAHTDIITSAAFAPDGQTVALASQDGTVHLWKVPHQP